MVARHEHDAAIRCLGRNPERIAFALDDERRDADRIELGQPAPRARTRRLEGEGKTEDRGGTGRTRSAACHAGTRRAAADDER